MSIILKATVKFSVIAEFLKAVGRGIHHNTQFPTVFGTVDIATNGIRKLIC